MADEGNNNEFPQGEPGRPVADNNGNEEVLDSGSRPAVAAAPGKFLIIGVFALIFVAIVVKSLFFTSAPPPPAPTPVRTKVSEAGAEPNINPQELPPPPSLNVPTTAAVPESNNPPAPPPYVAPPPPVITTQTNEVSNEQEKARMRASMLIGTGGTGGASHNSENANHAPASSDPNSAFASNVEETSTVTVEATRIKSNLNHSILQGKIIEGILETAIDSQLPGKLRAIVSHDTYAENGRQVLIPKGSRLIGTYNSGIKHGQARVFIIWTRIIRPDGIDIAIGSPGVDGLGRSGMGGYVDNRYFDMFSGALFTSTIDIGLAALGDALFGNQQQTTTTSGGGTTTTSSDTATAMQTAVQNIGSIGQSIVSNIVNLTPTIHVDQGEVINIFVDRDVVFPDSILGGDAAFIP